MSLRGYPAFMPDGLSNPSRRGDDGVMHCASCAGESQGRNGFMHAAECPAFMAFIDAIDRHNGYPVEEDACEE